MDIRILDAADLAALLALYRHLHAQGEPPPETGRAQAVWHRWLDNPACRAFGGFVRGELVASCTLITVPNLTRGCRPYGWIENVVTDANWRRQGLGTALLTHALQQAWAAGCYKVMLMTSSRDPAIWRFYEAAGFDPHDKRAFVARPG